MFVQRHLLDTKMQLPSTRQNSAVGDAEQFHENSAGIARGHAAAHDCRSKPLSLDLAFNPSHNKNAQNIAIFRSNCDFFSAHAKPLKETPALEIVISSVLPDTVSQLFNSIDGGFPSLS